MEDNYTTSTKLEKGISDMKSILIKYNLPSCKLADAIVEYHSFQVIVPFIGAFNTGKSSAINALLDFSLLPSSITANTTVPTEIVYGENTMTVFRGENAQNAGLHELRDKTLDLTDVTMIHLELNNPFLRRIPNVKMVDMPGLDSGISAHDRAMRSYLPNSLAYILMFSADEPVVKKSVGDFLSELRLREMPVYVVLSKCDKVTAETVEQAKKYLGEAVESLLGLDNAQVLCIRAKLGRDISSLEQLLIELQGRADSMRDAIFAEKLTDAARSAAAYIRQRLLGERMPASELDGRISRLQARMRRIDDAIKIEGERFGEQTDRCVEAVRGQVFEGLREAKSAMLTTLLAGQPVWPQADRMLIGTMAEGAESEFSSALLRHLKAISAIIDADIDSTGREDESEALKTIAALIGKYTHDADKTSEEDEKQHQNFEPENHRPQAMHNGHRLVAPETQPRRQQPRIGERAERPRGISLSAKAVLDRFKGSREVFERMPMVPIQASRAYREKYVQQALIENVLPKLLLMAESCLKGGMAYCIAEIHDELSRAIEADYFIKQQALEDIRREKIVEESKREQRLLELQADLDFVEKLLNSADAASLGNNGEQS